MFNQANQIALSINHNFLFATTWCAICFWLTACFYKFFEAKFQWMCLHWKEKLEKSFKTSLWLSAEKEYSLMLNRPLMLTIKKVNQLWRQLFSKSLATYYSSLIKIGWVVIELWEWKVSGDLTFRIIDASGLLSIKEYTFSLELHLELPNNGTNRIGSC